MRKNNEKTINGGLTSVFQYNSKGYLMTQKGQEILTARNITKTKNTKNSPRTLENYKIRKLRWSKYSNNKELKLKLTHKTRYDVTTMS